MGRSDVRKQPYCLLVREVEKLTFTIFFSLRESKIVRPEPRPFVKEY